MTLDEAIRHAEKVAERLETSCKRDWMGEDDERCASEHRQLAAWLKELKAYKEQSGDVVSQQAVIDNECMFSDYTDMPYQFDNMTGSMNL